VFVGSGGDRKEGKDPPQFLGVSKVNVRSIEVEKGSVTFPGSGQLLIMELLFCVIKISMFSQTT